MESFPKTPLSPQITQLCPGDLSIQKLQDHLLLVYTGITKQGQAFFEEMVERYCLREARTLQAIKRNNMLNRELAKLLVAGDLRSIGQLMQSQWENWKILSDGKCTSPQIDHLFDGVRPYVYGARMNGAGPGGCAMFVTKEGRKEDLIQLSRAILRGSITFYAWQPIL